VQTCAFPISDVTIRRLTGGRKSLDDFCTAFHGQNDNGRVWVKPYDEDEVYGQLNTTAPFHWQKFFVDRLQTKTSAIPLGGVEGGGYAFVYTDAANIFTDPWALDGSINAYGSRGSFGGAGGT